jgi:hypothetical protein
LNNNRRLNYDRWLNKWWYNYNRRLDNWWLRLRFWLWLRARLRFRLGLRHWLRHWLRSRLRSRNDNGRNWFRHLPESKVEEDSKIKRFPLFWDCLPENISLPKSAICSQEQAIV